MVFFSVAQSVFLPYAQVCSNLLIMHNKQTYILFVLHTFTPHSSCYPSRVIFISLLQYALLEISQQKTTVCIDLTFLLFETFLTFFVSRSEFSDQQSPTKRSFLFFFFFSISVWMGGYSHWFIAVISVQHQIIPLLHQRVERALMIQRSIPSLSASRCPMLRVSLRLL